MRKFLSEELLSSGISTQKQIQQSISTVIMMKRQAQSTGSVTQDKQVEDKLTEEIELRKLRKSSVKVFK